MSFPKIACFSVVLIAGLSFFSACGDDSASNSTLPESSADSEIYSSTEPAVNDSTQTAESSSSIVDTISSSSSEQEPVLSSSSSAKNRLPVEDDEEGAHYESYPVTVSTLGSYTFFDYDDGYCKVNVYHSGRETRTFNWVPTSNRLAVRKYSDTLIVFRINPDEKLIDTTEKIYDIYTGNSEDIYGEWLYQGSYIYGSYSPAPNKLTRIFTKDSIHKLTYVNPTVNYTTPRDVYSLFSDIFENSFLNETPSQDRDILEDIPSRGITMRATDSSVLIDINDLKMEYMIKPTYTRKTISYDYTLKSANKTCSYTYSAMEMESSHCSDTYTQLIKATIYNDHITRILEDSGKKLFFIECAQEMTEGDAKTKDDSEYEDEYE